MIIAFAILGWTVFPLFSILAWVFGNQDLREIDSGIMDPAGRDLTQVGKVIGMVHCILGMIAIAIGFLFLLFAFGFGVIR